MMHVSHFMLDRSKAMVVRQDRAVSSGYSLGAFACFARF